MTFPFFHQRFDYGVNEVLSWFGINLMVSFQDITQNLFFILPKSHIQLPLKFTISTWILLLRYIDDTLLVSIAHCAVYY